jgi:hypothetical protein
MSSLVKNIHNLNDYYCTADVISTVLVDLLNPQTMTSGVQCTLMDSSLCYHYLDE